MTNVRKFPKESESQQLPRFYEFGPFSLDAVKRLLLENGEPVPLTPKALDLLLVLVQDCGSVLTKDELLSRVWPDTVVEEGNLNRNISTLRKALGEAPGEHQYVVTIPGRGYSFVAEVRKVPDNDRSGVSAGTVAAPPGSETEVAARPLQAGSTRPVKWRRAGTAGLGLAIVALVLAGVWLDRWAGRLQQGVQAGGARIQSLAVLPLDNLSGDPAQDYFAAGITDELTTELAHIRGLRVVSRTSASQFQGGHRSLPDIARALAVDGVIEGSVVRAGNKVRITTQLIEAAKDRHLWAGTYEDSIDEVIALQDRVARDVAREVRAAVKPEDAFPLASARGRQPVDRQAYDDYLQGLYAWNRRDQRTFERAIECFSRAAAEDPHFPSAFASLADAYILYALNGQPSAKYGPLARQAALQALAQDANSAEAHAALAATSAVFDWDWPTAGKEFQRAIDLDPNYATGHQWHADFYLAPELQLDQAGKEMETALALDPLSPIMLVDDGWARYLRGDYPRALQQYQRALAMDPDFIPAHFRMEGWYLTQRQDAEFARAVAENARIGSQNENLARAIEAGFAREGIRGLARAALDTRDKYGRGPQGIVAAQYYAMLGDTTRTCAVLRTAVGEHDIALLYLNVDPRYADLRALPCSTSVAQQMGLPQLTPAPESK